MHLAERASQHILKTVLYFVLSFLIMVRVCEAPGSSDDNVTMDFDLFPEIDFGGIRVYSFKDELRSKEPLVLFKTATPAEAMRVKSARVKRFEGGTVVELYHSEADKQPSVTISSLVDIRGEVELPKLDHNYTRDNVHVFVADNAKTDKFEKVVISHPSPQFLVL